MSLHEGSARKAQPAVPSRQIVEVARPKAAPSASIKRAVARSYRSAAAVQGRSDTEEFISLVLHDSLEQDTAALAAKTSGAAQKQSSSNQTTPRQFRRTRVGDSSNSADMHVSREVSPASKEDREEGQYEIPRRAHSYRHSHRSKLVDVDLDVKTSGVAQKQSSSNQTTPRQFRRTRVGDSSNSAERHVSREVSPASKEDRKEGQYEIPSKLVDVDLDVFSRSRSECASNLSKHVDLDANLASPISERSSRGMHVDYGCSPHERPASSSKKAIDGKVLSSLGEVQPRCIRTRQLARLLRHHNGRRPSREDENEQTAWSNAESFVLQTKKCILEKLKQTKKEEEDRIKQEEEKRQQVLAQEKHKRMAAFVAGLLAAPEKIDQAIEEVGPVASPWNRWQKLQSVTSHQAYAEQRAAREEMEANASVQAEIVKAQEANPKLTPDELFWMRKYKLALEMQRQDESATEQAEQLALAAFGTPGAIEPNTENLLLAAGI
eukprot:TRINITY_DN1361_c0_g1_i3.p1 TRINITY_DN1361_c0_g1~~TRINITY_DN1361_c0_g1_i3.p1  ORF type:complete len:493 (-),score=65.25 TRINITY_DN1361_c0_g1_i3:77-1555(-)